MHNLKSKAWVCHGHIFSTTTVRPPERALVFTFSSNISKPSWCCQWSMCLFFHYEKSLFEATESLPEFKSRTAIFAEKRRGYISTLESTAKEDHDHPVESSETYTLAGPEKAPTAPKLSAPTLVGPSLLLIAQNLKSQAWGMETSRNECSFLLPFLC